MGAIPLGFSCGVAAEPDLDKGKPKGGVSPSNGASVAGKGVVVSREDPKVFAANGRDEARVKELVNRAVMSLVDVKKPDEAYRALFKPTDIVAIKLNCLAGPTLSSSVSVVSALVVGLHSIGIEYKQMVIFESTDGMLERAGYELNRYSTSKPRCLGNDRAGFDRDIQFSGEVGSLFSNVIAKQATALINVPVLKDHDLSGVACGMKNMYGLIHNPNRYHDNNCDPYVADVCAHPYVKDKLRLTLTDALNAQYQGGPARVVQHQWRANRVMASTDPVAMDRIAQDIIEEQRAKHGMPTLKEAKRPPKWLATAAKKGLGVSDIDKIKLDRA